MQKMPELPFLGTPSGGGAIKGMGDTFNPDAFTGVNTISFPISVSQCRDVTPGLVLNYATSGGNGPYGLGCSIGLPRISRRADKHIPRYDDADEYVAAGGEVLVPWLAKTDGVWQPIVHRRTGPDGDYRVALYRTREAGAPTRYECWQRLSDGDQHWRTVDTSNTVTVLGTSGATRIMDPANPADVFAWLIESSVNDRGDSVLYGYKAEDAVGIPPLPSNAGRDDRAERYIERIRYGAYESDGATAYAFEIVFDYGEHDLSPGNPDPYVPARPWPARPDPFSSYRSGFEIRTNRLCHGVMVFHNVPELGSKPCLAGVNQLDYVLQDGVSLLSRVDYRGTRRRDDGLYDTLSMPGVSLAYQPFAPAGQVFVPIVLRSGQLPFELGSAPLVTADLDGEGLPGLLFSTGSACLFWRNQGNASFAPPLTPDSMPAQRNVSTGRETLIDLAGDGRLDCVVSAPGRAGFYRNEGSEHWRPFEPFMYNAAEASGPAAQFADLTGDGLADLLVMQPRQMRWYRGLGEAGYAVPAEIASPADLPNPQLSDANERILFADPFGDGGTHLMRIRDGAVVCWPGLGWGRFGGPVMFDNAPRFPGGLDTRRLLVADVSSSGAVDLVYFMDDHLLLYLNLGGNGFADPVAIALPVSYSALTQTATADFLGGGSQNILLGLPASNGYLLDVTGGNKPWLATQLTSDLGGTMQFRYGSSAHSALRDARDGHPWPTKVPFPVHIVTGMTVRSAFSGAVQETRFAYHDGYYDREDRAFRGFGYVETWVDEQVPEAAPMPTSYTRSWFETGAFVGGNALSAAYAAQAWRGDPSAPPCPDSVIELLSQPAGQRDLHDGYRALQNRLLRRERYQHDGSAQDSVPIIVEANNFTVRELQPSNDRNAAVFEVDPRQSLTLVYDRVSDDPRITADFTLEVDDHGEIVMAASVGYPRRAAFSPVPPQQQPLITATQRFFAENLSAAAYLPVEPSVEIDTEIGNVSADPNGWFTYEAIYAAVTAALGGAILPPETPFSGLAPQARMRTWKRYYYWDAQQQAPLALGSVVSPALPHHNEAAQLSVGQVAEAYGERLPAARIAKQGFYVLSDGYWWNPGTVMTYGAAAQWFAPVATTDASGTRRSIVYDSCGLMPVSATTPDGTSTATPDYQAMLPATFTDVNHIVTQSRFDALARVVVVTNRHGEEGDGDISTYQPKVALTPQQVADDPASYLQQMTSYYFYSFEAGSGQPPCVVGVTRQFHVSQLQPNQPSPWRMSISYYDSGGQALEHKQWVDAAAAGTPDPVWRSDGLTLFSVRGTTLCTWRPSFSAMLAFSGYAGGLKDVLTLDAEARVVRTLTAKGFVSRTIYASWSVTLYDLDDAVKQSPYYQANINNTDPAFADQRDALIKAAVFENTPTTQLLDPRGRPAWILEINMSADAPTPVQMTTSSVLDIDGLTVAMADPRFTALNSGGGQPIYNVTTTYDLAGNGIVVSSVDAGVKAGFYDALGRVAEQWGARGVHTTRVYDAMGRILTVHVDGALGLDQLVEVSSYGMDPLANNVGRLVEVRDEAGITTYAGFNLEGTPGTVTFALRVGYQAEVDWSPGNSVPVEPPLTSVTTFDAFGQLIHKASADGSTTDQVWYSPGWLAASTVTAAGASATAVLSGAVYNADGSRLRARLADVDVVRTYEATTGRLTGIVSTRNSDGKALQEIAYAYDPVGNVTRSQDATVPLVFYNQAQITPLQDYFYTAIYQLHRATGRENPAIGAGTYRTGFKQSVYIPLNPEGLNDAVKLVPYQETYLYDLSGNLTSIGHVTPESGLSWTRDFTVSTSSNRAIIKGSGTNPDDAYDAAGNMVLFDPARNMDWEWRNKPRRAVLVAREGDPDDAQFYVYDSSGQRMRRVNERLTAGGLQVDDKVYFDGCEFVRTLSPNAPPLVERQGLSVGVDSGRLLMMYSWPNAEPARGPQFRFQLPTLTGSAALEVGKAGEIISYEEYFPYGGTSIIAGNLQTDVELKYYRFCGKECDDATGLYFFGDRYYVSWMGRWLSPDPNGPIDGLNLYQYVAGNPLSNTDESGGCKQSISVAATTFGFTSFELSYHYLSAPVVKTYEDLSQELHEHIYKFQPKALTDETERIPPKIEQGILDMLESFKGAHLGSNPELMKIWDAAKDKSGGESKADKIKAYTATRSPHFTNFMNETEMGDIVSKPEFYRTVELHHGLKKSFRPQFAIDPRNLWALSRGGSSYGPEGVVGAHEGAFHLVGAAGFGNRYTTEVGAYSGIVKHWQGLGDLPGDAPGLPVSITVPSSLPITLPILSSTGSLVTQNTATISVKRRQKANLSGIRKSKTGKAPSRRSTRIRKSTWPY